MVNVGKYTIPMDPSWARLLCKEKQKVIFCVCFQHLNNGGVGTCIAGVRVLKIGTFEGSGYLGLEGPRILRELKINPTFPIAYPGFSFRVEFLSFTLRGDGPILRSFFETGWSHQQTIFNFWGLCWYVQMYFINHHQTKIKTFTRWFKVKKWTFGSFPGWRSRKTTTDFRVKGSRKYSLTHRGPKQALVLQIPC